MMTLDFNTHFTRPLLGWFDQHGRKTLPWQHPKTPYRVYVSEIMLQQTQVKTVIPYFERFMAHFPTLQALADAPEEAVLSHWSGLGYYSRARNLHQTAQCILSQHGGEFPQQLEQLTQLPGIGPSTAAAIASLAFNQCVAILDGNVKRVLARYFNITAPINDQKTEKKLIHYATACLSADRCADYTQAIMDLGALCCKPKHPNCTQCPLNATCLAYQTNHTERLPVKHKKAPLPIKSAQFFLLYRFKPCTTTYQVYLEKRPAKGIWGCLWCLPNDLIETPSFPCQYGSPPQLFAEIKHTFTHFHLHMRVSSQYVSHTADNMQWFSQTQLSSLGLPKPISCLLNQFFDQPPTILQSRTMAHTQAIMPLD